MQETLTAGVPHIVKIRRDGFIPIDTNLVFAAGETKQIRLTLVRNP
jgi:hypothetical protein